MEDVPVKWSHVLAAVAMGVILFACSSSNDNLPSMPYTCGFTASASTSTARCGEGDPDLPPEPTLPSSLCDITNLQVPNFPMPAGTTNPLVANKSFPDESN